MDEAPNYDWLVQRLGQVDQVIAKIGQDLTQLRERVLSLERTQREALAERKTVLEEISRIPMAERRMTSGISGVPAPRVRRPGESTHHTRGGRKRR